MKFCGILYGLDWMVLAYPWPQYSRKKAGKTEACRLPTVCICSKVVHTQSIFRHVEILLESALLSEVGPTYDRRISGVSLQTPPSTTRQYFGR